MIIGCGIDLVNIERIEKLIKKWGVKFLQKVFNEQEIRYCEKKNKGRYQSYAGFFAAKEACVKALGTGFRNIEWKEIEVSKDPLGKPVICLSKRLSVINKSRNINNIHLSISHTEQLAIAQVIIER
jgi:holo-[acyl-carrier protein] synthase